MSDVNKLDNKQCPFDPEQYKFDALSTLEGTPPWALIQVYLGNKVHRKDWSTLDEYILLVPGSGNDAPEIRKRDKHGVMTSWQPAQEDLMACDWSLLKSEPKPDDCMLEFDLKIGAGKFGEVDQAWGYLDEDIFSFYNLDYFGVLTNFSNKVDVKKIMLFIWDSDSQIIQIQVYSDNDLEGYGRMEALFHHDLTVNVDGTPYHLGSATTLDLIYKGKKTLFLNLCNCLFLICLIYQLIQVKRWTRNSYKPWLLSWLKISKRPKI